jgi:hypothetical protein
LILLPTYELGSKKKAMELARELELFPDHLPFTLTSILRQMKNCGNSNISPCKNIIFKKSSKRNQNASRH